MAQTGIIKLAAFNTNTMSTKTKLLIGLLVIGGAIGGAFYLSGDDGLMKGSLTGAQTACNRLQTGCSKNPKAKGCEKLKEVCKLAALDKNKTQTPQAQPQAPAEQAQPAAQEAPAAPAAPSSAPQAPTGRLKITLDPSTPARRTATRLQSPTFLTLRFEAENAPITVNKLSFIVNVDDGNISNIQNVDIRSFSPYRQIGESVTRVDDHVGLVSFSRREALFTVQPGTPLLLDVLGLINPVQDGARMTIMLHASLNNTNREIEITTDDGRFGDSMNFMPPEIDLVEANHFVGLFTPGDKIIRGNEVVGLNETDYYAAQQQTQQPGSLPSAAQSVPFSGDSGSSTSTQQAPQGNPPPSAQNDNPQNHIPPGTAAFGQTDYNFSEGTSTQQ